MYIFPSIGIPVIALFLSFFSPPVTSAHTKFRFQERRVPRVISRPSMPTLPTRLAISATATPTETPVLIKPTTIPINSLQTTSTPTSTSGDSKKIFIMDAINEYRTSQGLSPVQINDATCNFAKTRAQEVINNFNHDGFNERIQNHTLPYPNYSLVTENIAETSNFQEVVRMWQNSPAHAANMRADTPYVCVENSGDYYAYEGWKPQ